MSDKHERARAAHQRQRAINETTLALLSGLNAFGVSHYQPTVTRPSSNTIAIKKTEQSVLLITVQEPDKFDVGSPADGPVQVNPVRAQEGLGEREMMKVIVTWLCAEVAD
jgi:hypothetical protein